MNRRDASFEKIIHVIKSFWNVCKPLHTNTIMKCSRSVYIYKITVLLSYLPLHLLLTPLDTSERALIMFVRIFVVCASKYWSTVFSQPGSLCECGTTNTRSGRSFVHCSASYDSSNPYRQRISHKKDKGEKKSPRNFLLRHQRDLSPSPAFGIEEWVDIEHVVHLHGGKDMGQAA